MSGKLLMVEKLSLKSFIYDMIENSVFQVKMSRKLLKSMGSRGLKFFMCWHSASLKFIFIFDPTCEISESKYRDIIFEIITSSQIYKRFDSSHKFCDILGAKKEQKKKKLGYCEIEHIDNPCILTLAVNQK